MKHINKVTGSKVGHCGLHKKFNETRLRALYLIKLIRNVLHIIYLYCNCLFQKCSFIVATEKANYRTTYKSIVENFHINDRKFLMRKNVPRELFKPL